MGFVLSNWRNDLEFDLKPEWLVTSPGVINLNTTNVSIAYHPSYGVYYIMWNGKAVHSKGMHFSLESAKEVAIAYIHDLLKMGYEP